MRPLIRYSLTQTVLFNLLFVIMIVVGFISLFSLPVERYPQINFGKVIIYTYFPGANPHEVETLVTREIEEGLEDLENVEFIRSTSYRERSSILVKFEDDSDYERLYKELRLKILGIKNELPAGIEGPSFTNIRTSDWLPVISVNLAGKRGNRALTLMAEEMKIPLQRIPGVQEVKLRGEFEREFHVHLDPGRMARHGVTFDQVSTALKNADVSIPAGDFSGPDGEFVIVVDEIFRSREEVVSTVIRRDLDGSFVTVGDVASRAELAHRDPFVVTSVNGQDSVTLSVIKTEAGNALDIKEGVMEVVDGFRDSLTGEGVDLVMTQDSTVYIRDAMDTLGWNLLVGVILVALIIWWFMGFRNACLITVGIPFSFLVTMCFMRLTGNSLNEVTLFSFVLVSGIIVDDAIVVVENIYRHIQGGAPLNQAIVEGAAEVAFPVISATTTTAAAFLPMLIMTGSTGEFFALVPKAVSFAIAASLIECLLILPLHFKDFGPRPSKAGNRELEEHDNPILALARELTDRVTSLTLKYRFSSLGVVTLSFVVAVAVFAVSASGLAPLIRIKFYPDDYNLYYVVLQGPSTTPVGEISNRLKEISRFVMADGPGMAQSTVAFAGFYMNEDYELVYGNNYGNVVVTLPGKELRDFGPEAGDDPVPHLEIMREKLEKEFENKDWSIRVRAEKGGPPAGKDVTVRAVGTDPDAVRDLAREMLAFMRANPDIGPSLTDLEDDQGLPNRVFRFQVDHERSAEYDLSPAQTALLAASVLDGRYNGKFRLKDEEIDLKLRIDPGFLSSPTQGLSLPLIEHESGPVRLGDVCTVETYTEPGYLTRFNGDRSTALTANLKPGAPTSTPAIINLTKKHYQAIRDKHHGAVLDFAGDFESTRRSYISLSYAFGLALLIIYLILANQFKSYIQPLIIISAVIFSLIGVVFGKLFTQTLFTINSFIALVGVTGVVVNDSLVLVDFMNRCRQKGMTRQDSITQGIRVRLRPILLTTLTTSLGLFPMAVGFPQYSVVWGTMASTFVTGLFTATGLTLFIVPVQWDLLEQFKERRKNRQKGIVSSR